MILIILFAAYFISVTKGFLWCIEGYNNIPNIERIDEGLGWFIWD